MSGAAQAAADAPAAAALDLAPLERAAGEAGFPDLTARLAPPDPRRGWWFRVRGRELLVNERVVERVAPPEGRALLVVTLLQQRRLGQVRRTLLVSGIAAAVALVGLDEVAPALVAWGGVLVGAGLFAAAAVGWSRSALAADDEAVELLEDPELLARALNSMNQDKLEVAGRTVDARPDLHRRAERLVTKHQLKLPPERRTVRVYKEDTGCGAGWDAGGAPVGRGE